MSVFNVCLFLHLALFFSFSYSSSLPCQCEMGPRVALRFWFSFHDAKLKIYQKVTCYRTESGIICEDHIKKCTGARWRAGTLFIKWSF